MTEPQRPSETVHEIPPADPLDAGLAAAFGNDAPPSPTAPTVGLRQPPGDPPDPDDPAAQQPTSTAGRNLLFGEIARGGMGAVLRGRDPALGRELAVKMLLEKHRGNPELTARFVEEAQIAGQLQHPGIIPVYELGQFGDDRPFFTMKLVKGQTLARLLEQRANPQDRLPRFLAIFEQLCQTVAYAHARGVIHRDLKPLNVMVGSFGEVQVMDWGLAKVLCRGAAPPETAPPAQELTQIRTVPAGSTADGDRAGTLFGMGTPGYMPPEQALGEADQIDERTDVFALGAILCVILTGQPPFAGTADEMRRQTCRSDLAVAHARLDASGADADLLRLARNCLAARREDRPRDAGEVATAVTAYLAGVAERLRAAEVAQAAAQARAEQEARARVLAERAADAERAKALYERKARRLTLAFTASVLLTMLLGGGGGLWLKQQADARAAERMRRSDEIRQGVELLIREAEARQKEGRMLIGDPDRWEGALKIARNAAEQAERATKAKEAPEGLAEQVGSLLVCLTEDEEDLRMVRGLEQARSLGYTLGDSVAIRAAVEPLIDPAAPRGVPLFSGGPVIASVLAYLQEHPDVDAAYHRAFRDYRLDPGKVSAQEAANRIRQRPIKDQLLLGLLTWNALRRHSKGADDPLCKWAVDVANVTDSQLIYLQHRIVAEQSRQIWALGGAGTVGLLGSSLGQGPLVTALTVISEFKVPASTYSDGWLTWPTFMSPVPQDTQFMSQTPLQRLVLASAYRETQNWPALEALLRYEQRNQPQDYYANNDLALFLASGTEAETPRLEQAARFCSAALALRPRELYAYRPLLWALLKLQDYRHLEDVSRSALRLNPSDPELHQLLGAALMGQRRHAECITAYEEASGLAPNNARYHFLLGMAHRGVGNSARALASFGEAARLDPRDAVYHTWLANMLCEGEHFEEAAVEYCHAISCNERDGSAYYWLGVLLDRQGKKTEARDAFRKATLLKPEDVGYHQKLGFHLTEMNEWDQAIGEFQTAIKLRPDDKGTTDSLCLVYNQHARILGWSGNYEEAVAALRKALDLKPGDKQTIEGFMWVYNLQGSILNVRGRHAEAVTAHRKALEIKPDDAQTWALLGTALAGQGKNAEAKAALRKALGLKPGDLLSRFQLWALEQVPEDQPALAELERGNAHFFKGNYPDACIAYEKLVELKPNWPAAHWNLGQAYRQAGELTKALEQLKRYRDFGPASNLSAEGSIHSLEQLVELDRKLPALAEGKEKPGNVDRAALAWLFAIRHFPRAAARTYAEALTDDPKLSGHRYNAACAATLAAAGQGKDAIMLDDGERAGLRQQALDWLKADLAAWTALAESGKSEDRQMVLQKLKQWQTDPDLSGIRNGDAVAKLPTEEREAWQKLWAGVAALQNKVQDKPLKK
jgi:serine/threonine-protein kinase